MTSHHYALSRPEEIDGLVIHCSDPRFQKAFNSFIADELGMKTPAKIIVPGGIHDLVSPVRTKAARQMWEQLEFMIKELKLDRVAIINHEDCKWYGKWSVQVVSKIDHDVADHLKAAAEKLVGGQLKVTVEAYLAKVKNGQVIFEKI